MKKAIFIVILLTISHLIFADANVFNERIYIEGTDKQLPGNSIFKVYNGWATVLTYEDNTPAILSFFDKNGQCRFQKSYRSVINLSISENGRFAAFFNGKDITVIDLSSLMESSQPGSILFSVDNCGKLDLNTGLIGKFVPDRIKRNLNLRKTDNSAKNPPDNIINLHEPILAPLLSETDSLPIGNSYSEIQNYGNSSYLHPGVDFLGAPYQVVRAVRPGYVKSILTTGGNLYWRIAIANEETDSLSVGYLYAHLEEDSICVNIGDYVVAGQKIGVLTEWPSYNFNHCHFARIQDQGTVWEGQWWTVNNPLPDVVDFSDISSPVFENIIENTDEIKPFVFKNEQGIYQSNFLRENITILARCYDQANSPWKIDIFSMGFRFSPINNPDSIVYNQFSYAFDMPNDDYLSNESFNLNLISVLYNIDDTYNSTGNYEQRLYYHPVSHSNGDSLLTESDGEQFFDTHLLENGDYILTVYAYDASGNYAEKSMPVYIFNEIPISDETIIKPKITKLTNYPNPFNPSTVISFDNTQEQFINLSIFNLKGQLVKTLLDQPVSAGNHRINWDGKNNRNQNTGSGIYFVRLKSEKTTLTHKIIMIK
jgi:hypothetical protein